MWAEGGPGTGDLRPQGWLHLFDLSGLPPLGLAPGSAARGWAHCQHLGPSVGVHSPAERCSPVCSHPVTPPYRHRQPIRTSACFLSRLSLNLKLVVRKNKREEEGGKRRQEKPSSHTHPQFLGDGQGGGAGWDQEPERGRHGHHRDQIPGLLFPPGWLFWESSFIPADWLPPTLESGSLRALPGPSAGKGRENSPREQRASSRRPRNSALSIHRPTYPTCPQAFTKDHWAPGILSGLQERVLA